MFGENELLTVGLGLLGLTGLGLVWIGKKVYNIYTCKQQQRYTQHEMEEQIEQIGGNLDLYTRLKQYDIARTEVAVRFSEHIREMEGGIERQMVRFKQNDFVSFHNGLLDHYDAEGLLEQTFEQAMVISDQLHNHNIVDHEHWQLFLSYWDKLIAAAVCEEITGPKIDVILEPYRDQRPTFRKLQKDELFDNMPTVVKEHVLHRLAVSESKARAWIQEELEKCEKLQELGQPTPSCPSLPQLSSFIQEPTEEDLADIKLPLVIDVKSQPYNPERGWGEVLHDIWDAICELVLGLWS